MSMRKIISQPSNGIVIVPYSDLWPSYFAAEEELLYSLMGGAALIEHIGSTAVLGLAAKPIIDMCMVVRKLEEKDHYSLLLKPLDYKYKSGYTMTKWLLFGKQAPHISFHLHIMPVDNKRWREQIRFRDKLQANPSLAKNYEWLKYHYAERDDPLFYSMNKLPFVEAVLGKLPAE